VIAAHDVHLRDQVHVRQCPAPQPDESRRIEAAFQVFETICNRVPHIPNGGDVEQFTVRHD
jgi:hypothetical protein